MNEKLAIQLLQFIAKKLDERMEYAKRHSADKRAINIAGFCSELKKEIGQEKARIIGEM